jgi:hypothetical protein
VPYSTEDTIENKRKECDAFPTDEVGRCRLTVSNPELKARLVSALETKT